MNERPTLALCGAGMIAAVHGMAASALRLPVGSVASRTPAKAARLAAQLGARTVTYADLPDGADIVIVATPPGCHADDTLRLLDAGAAVVLEKPLCRTLDEADRLVAASDAHGHRLLYAENLAFAPIIVELIRRARGLGPLQWIEVRALQPLPTWGAFTTDEWGGGALFDLGVHPVAVALFLAGPDREVAVSCRLTGGSGHATDEHAELTIEFASGLHARVVASWQGSGDAVWDAQASSATGVVRAELFPELDLEQQGEPVALPPLEGVEPAIVEQAGYFDQLRSFVGDLNAGRRPLMDARFGRRVLDLVCAAYASAGDDGQRVLLPFAGRRDRTPLQLWRDPPP